MEIFVFCVVIIIASLLWALMEIQIEGKNGWAAALPTWRYKVYVKYLWEREITGYHVFLMTFIVLILHSIFLYVQWNLVLEFRVLSFFLIMAVIEDFFWFIFNPNFGIHKFDRNNVPWHSMWFLYLPTFYWVVLPLGFLLYGISLSL